MFESVSTDLSYEPELEFKAGRWGTDQSDARSQMMQF
jgi:hypothetical protein